MIITSYIEEGEMTIYLLYLALCLICEAAAWIIGPPAVFRIGCRLGMLYLDKALAQVTGNGCFHMTLAGLELDFCRHG